MPHVALVAMSGFRVVDEELLSIGITLPGLSARSEAIAELPSLGLLTLAAMTPDPWTISYHLAANGNDEVLSEILGSRPRLVVFSALTASVNTAYSISQRLRALGILTALGGLHATACPDEAMHFVDAVCVGDGEPIWNELLTDAENGQLKRRYQARAWSFPESAIIPRWDLIGPGRLARYTIQTQRGCPLACSFCAASRLLGPFREKPATALREELAAIVGHAGPKRPLIEFSDDNTFAGKRLLEDFWEVLTESGVQFFTESDWRIGERPEIYHHLRAAGCYQVLIGIESLVFRYPGMGEKQAELDRILDSVRRLQENGVAVNGCFIVGGEGESRDSMERLADFLESSPFADIQVTLQTPYPGTSLYRQLLREGRILSPPRDWTAYTLFDVTYRPDSLTPEDLRRGFLGLIQRVYRPDATLRRQRIRREIDRSARRNAADQVRGSLNVPG